MGEPSYTQFIHQVDDFYFSALSHGEEQLFPISDEKYAEELQFQEVLMSSFIASGSHSTPPAKRVKLRGESSKASLIFCKICMEASQTTDMFQNNNCSHVFCLDCLARYLAAKIQEKISTVKCPEINCKGVLEPEFCREIVPAEVFERWENALCESMLLESKKFYCPFKDCSALLVDDGEERVAQSECPNCRRLFCAQCKVAWHLGLSCKEYQRLGADERGREDLMLMEIANKKKWQKCPRCKFLVEKTEGCLHITCRSAFSVFWVGLILVGLLGLILVDLLLGSDFF
ncbi:RBR-type E3 ubiquitin transferase [Cocos nucifera]|uniref:RBR-type E3 ubiquitin transferase n=1 Tax=Cocos nucifera TaxID=13894 RepID=A0A8K0IH60_COCNU|nr:RBR-type E3 ubiquitin transferase [Cocos nucifera]